MRQFVCCAMLALGGAQASADGYVLGSGRWTCAEAIRISNEGTGLEVGQLAGWILGYWSSATFQRDTAFVDTVERVGGTKIYDATIAECGKAPPDTIVIRIVEAMIKATNTQ